MVGLIPVYYLKNNRYFLRNKYQVNSKRGEEPKVLRHFTARLKPLDKKSDTP